MPGLAAGRQIQARARAGDAREQALQLEHVVHVKLTVTVGVTIDRDRHFARIRRRRCRKWTAALTQTPRTMRGRWPRRGGRHR